MSTTKTKVQRLILYHDPSTLQSLAAVTVAAHLWRWEIAKSTARVRRLNTAIPALAKFIPEIPPTVEKLIDKCVEPVRQSLLVWLTLHFLRIFIPYVKEYDILRNHFDLICWRADCTIDYELTAEKFVDCVELDVVCKYKLACSYCLEDDVRRLWNELPSTYHDLSKALYSANHLVKYWDRLMKIEQASSIVGGGSIDGKLFDKLKPENWLAWKYCWSRLSPDHQIDKAVAMIDSKSGMEQYVKYLLPLLTKLQMVKVLKRCSQDVIAVLATSPENVKQALQTWHFIKTFVSSDSYVKIFVNILDLDLDVNMQLYSFVDPDPNSSNRMKYVDTTNMMNVNVSQLLYEIWQDSPDHLRTHLVDKHVVEILQKLSEMDNLFTLKTLCRDVRLILELLSRSNYLVNNAFWRKHWTDLIKGVKPSRLDEMMKLCFRNVKEICKFKKTYLSVYSKIEPYCSQLICEGYFDELNDFLSFCTTDPSVLLGLKRNILLNPTPTLKFCVYYSDNPQKMRAFDDFLSDSYPDSNRRKNFKCQMVTSLTYFKLLQWCISNGAMNPVKNFVTLFLTRDAELNHVKNSFKQQCQNILNKGEFNSFNGDHWNEFLLWCLNEDQQQLDQFKQSLPVGDIYHILFLSCFAAAHSRFSKRIALLDKYECADEFSKDPKQQKTTDMKECGSSSAACEALKKLDWDRNRFTDDYLVDEFETLDHFLLWYFASNAKVVEFKLAEIKKPSVQRRISAIKDGRLMKVVLHWFFNRDAQQIDGFVKSLNR